MQYCKEFVRMLCTMQKYSLPLWASYPALANLPCTCLVRVSHSFTAHRICRSLGPFEHTASSLSLSDIRSLLTSVRLGKLTNFRHHRLKPTTRQISILAIAVLLYLGLIVRRVRLCENEINPFLWTSPVTSCRRKG